MGDWNDDQEKRDAWAHLSGMVTRCNDKADEKVKLILGGLVALTAWFMVPANRINSAPWLLLTFGLLGALFVWHHNLEGRKTLRKAAPKAPTGVHDDPGDEAKNLFASSGLWLNQLAIIITTAVCATMVGAVRWSQCIMMVAVVFPLVSYCGEKRHALAQGAAATTEPYQEQAGLQSRIADAPPDETISEDAD